MNVLAAATGPSGNAAVGLVIWLAAIAAYFIPTVIAWIRHVPHRGSVTVINVFLGWTVIGWVVALAMACRSRPVVTPAGG
jgi:Superinfection immunity protein